MRAEETKFFNGKQSNNFYSNLKILKEPLLFLKYFIKGVTERPGKLNEKDIPVRCPLGVYFYPRRQAHVSTVKINPVFVVATS